jgi:phosphoglycolate phosphatase
VTRRWALLDLDGCLTDSAPGILNSVAHALSSLGLPVPDDLRSFLGPPLHVSFARLGVPDVDAAVAAYRERFSAVGITELSLYDGVPEALAALRADGWGLCLATSKPEVFAQRILAATGLDLDEVVGSELDGTRSVKADVITGALRRTGVTPDQAVMVGDRAEDCVGAAACGVRFVGAGWGYGLPGELGEAGADVIATSPRDLPDLLTTSHPRGS